MTDRERMLIHQLGILQAENDRLRGEVAELEESNANLCVEREATDVLFGEAWDLLAKSYRRPDRS